MKRYYSIDFLAMKHFGLNATKWMICENIHFTQAITDSGYCEHTRGELAEHHELSVAGLKRIVGELVDDGLIKRKSKHHLKTTPKWHKIQGSKNATFDNLGGSKNATPSEQNCYEGGSKNATPQPIRENLDRTREKKTNKKNENTRVAFNELIEEIKAEAPRKTKVEGNDKAFNAYLKIEDKSKIKEYYLSHQHDKGEFALRIAGFLMDYNAMIEDMSKAGTRKSNQDLDSQIDEFYGKDSKGDDYIDAEVE